MTTMTLCIAIGVCVGGLGGWSVGAWLTKPVKDKPARDAVWGAAVKGIGWPRVSGAPCRVVLNGERLASFAEEYRVAIACGIRSNFVDDMDNPNYKISEPFEIKPDDITIDVTPPDWDGKASLNMKVLVLPRNVKPSEIKTLSDVPKLGGQVLRMR